MITSDSVLELIAEEGRLLSIVVLDDYAHLLRQVNDNEFLVAVHDQIVRKTPVFIQDMDGFVEQFKQYFGGVSMSIEYFAVPKSAVIALIV